MPEPIELVFLGTGCAIPTLKRKHPAIILHRAGEVLLFDCGEGAQLGFEAAGMSLMKVSRIFITHWHADHFAGLLPIMETLHLSNRTSPLHVYGPEASKFVDALVELSYWGIGFPIHAKDCPMDGPSRLVETPEYEIHSIPVKHSVPAVGYAFMEKPHWKIDLAKAAKFGLKPGPVLKEIHEKGSVMAGGKKIRLEQVAEKRLGRKIVYSGDTLVCKELFEAARDADLLVHDGTFVEPMESRSHPSVSEVAKLAKKYGVKKLVLTHLSRRYKGTQETLDAAKAVFKNTVVAEDGMRIRL